MIPEPTNCEWAQDLIGLPWENAARGPSSYDCWGLLWHIYTLIFGITVPIYPCLDAKDVFAVNVQYEGAIGTGDWERIESPIHGCAVAMGGCKKIHHVGVWLDIDGGKILHCRDKAKVAAESIRAIHAQGIGTILFYRHKHHG